MTGSDLRAFLADLGLGAYDFAALIGVGHSTVYKWLKPDAVVPGYVETVVTLLLLLRVSRDLRAA